MNNYKREINSNSCFKIRTDFNNDDLIKITINEMTNCKLFFINQEDYDKKMAYDEIFETGIYKIKDGRCDLIVINNTDKKAFINIHINPITIEYKMPYSQSAGTGF